MKAFWTYTSARLGIFAITYAVLWAICFTWVEFGELTNLVMLGIAAVVSSIISFFALRGLRDKLAEHVQTRASLISERIEEARSAEDVD